MNKIHSSINPRTTQAISERLGLSIDTRFAKNELAELANDDDQLLQVGHWAETVAGRLFPIMSFVVLGFGIGMIEHDALGDPETTPQGDRVGREPTGCRHSPHDFGIAPHQRDVFDDWFRQNDFDACSFINVLLEMNDRKTRVGGASAAHLANIRSIIRELATEANLRDPEQFSHSWHILMKGSIVAAGEGDTDAARRAQAMGRLLIAQHR